MNLRRFIYLGGTLLFLLVVLTIDIIRKNVEIEIGGLSLIRGVLIIAAIVLVYLFLERTASVGRHSPVGRLGFVMAATLVMILFSALVVFSTDMEFDAKNYSLLPLGYGTIFMATLLSVSFAVFAVLMIRLLRDLVLYKRKRGTQRNFLIYTGLMLATAASTMVLMPLEDSVLTSIFFALAIALAVVNSFRLSWIVYLTKREKMFSLLYGFLVFCGFIALNVFLHMHPVDKSLLYYSYPLREFVRITCIFGNVYFGMAFVSTLFHLPTAEAFDRKTSEVSSLHNLSRLVTQVFDFDELVDTVTTMTLQVCEARSCWLEIIHYPDEQSKEGDRRNEVVVYNSMVGNYHVQIAAMKNISHQEIDRLHADSEGTLRDTVLEGRRPLVLDDMARDSHMQRGGKGKGPAGSMVVVPLVSHSGVIGILYATKESEYGFFKDDVDVISAFADQATIAIENSRLIKKSLERERLIKEMMVAQEMQRRLLPQSLPRYPSVEIDAVSTPAFEVGGDYYDFVEIDDARLGVVVGDVSGKGVSAAFYMSEVKGIFQALSRMYHSPKEFMIRANEALASSIDKRSFVSLMYAVLDARTGDLTLSRAGHCPMLLVSEKIVRYIRPSGMGMGLSVGRKFSEAIEEEHIRLMPGDVCVFYTDGVTETRKGEEEFGYDRLLDTVTRSRGKSAVVIKDNIIETVREFAEQQPSHDDLTVLVMKWQGPDQRQFS